MFKKILFIALFFALTLTLNYAQAESIQVLAPNGGECLTSGTAYSVSWSMSGIDHADVYYSSTGNEADKSRISHAVSGQTSYTWIVPSPDTSTGRIFIYGHSAAEATMASDSSDGLFNIMANCSGGGGGTDLVGHWKFDGNGVNEISGRPSAVAVGSASFNSSGGRIGGYGYIPANTDYFRVPYNSAYDLPDSFTVEFWFRQRADRNFLQNLVYKGNPTNNYNFYIYRQLWNESNYGPVIAGHTAANTGYWTQTSNPNQLSHNAWHHVAYTKSTSGQAYYLDGVLIHSKDFSQYPEYGGPARTPASDIIIGDSAVDTDIDDLKIYNRALTASEISLASSEGGSGGGGSGEGAPPSNGGGTGSGQTSTNAQVSGKVTDSTGAIVSGASINIFTSDYSSSFGESTVYQGSYVIYGFPARHL